MGPLLAFLRDWRSPDRLLIHFWAGSSRITAAALMAIAVGQPGQQTAGGEDVEDEGPEGEAEWADGESGG